MSYSVYDVHNAGAFWCIRPSHVTRQTQRKHFSNPGFSFQSKVKRFQSQLRVNIQSQQKAHLSRPVKRPKVFLNRFSKSVKCQRVFKASERPKGFQSQKVKIQSQSKAYLSRPAKRPKGFQSQFKVKIQSQPKAYVSRPKGFQSQSKAK